MTQDVGARAAVEAAWFALGRDFVFTGPHDRVTAHAIVADHRPRIEAAILANGAVFLPDAAELDRLRTALEGIVYANHPGESSSGGCLCADHEDARAALAPEGSARDGG